MLWDHNTYTTLYYVEREKEIERECLCVYLYTHSLFSHPPIHTYNVSPGMIIALIVLAIILALSIALIAYFSKRHWDKVHTRSHDIMPEQPNDIPLTSNDAYEPVEISKPSKTTDDIVLTPNEAYVSVIRKY